MTIFLIRVPLRHGSRVNRLIAAVLSGGLLLIVLSGCVPARTEAEPSSSVTVSDPPRVQPEAGGQSTPPAIQSPTAPETTPSEIAEESPDPGEVTPPPEGVTPTPAEVTPSAVGKAPPAAWVGRWQGGAGDNSDWVLIIASDGDYDLFNDELAIEDRGYIWPTENGGVDFVGSNRQAPLRAGIQGCQVSLQDEAGITYLAFCRGSDGFPRATFLPA